MPFDEPVLVVAFDKCEDGFTDLVGGLPGPRPEQLLLEGAMPALDHAIAFRLANERVTDRAAQVIGFIDVPGACELTAMIKAQGDTTSRILADSTELPSHCLMQAVERGESVGCGGDGDPEYLVGAVIDEVEDGHLAVSVRDYLGGISAPALIGKRSDDSPIVHAFGAAVPLPRGCQQPVKPHESMHTVAADAKASHDQSGPHLSISLSAEGTGGDDVADGSEQSGIILCGLWPWLGMGHRRSDTRLGGAAIIERARREVIDSQDHPHGVAQTGGRRADITEGASLPHRVLPRPFPRYSSSSIVSLPMVVCASASWRRVGSAASSPRSFRPSSMLASARSRHSSRRWTGTCVSRLTRSNDSPRSNRRTTSLLALKDQRLGVDGVVIADSYCPIYRAEVSGWNRGRAISRL